MRRLLVLALALAAIAPAAVASHASQYHTNPVERDDQGRSDEPDFQATSVLGPRLRNAVLDLDLDGRAAPDEALPPPPGEADVVAPGCTTDTGRVFSGVCGVCTVGAFGAIPPGALGCVTADMGPPPGAYTPTRNTRIRFLDVRHDAMAQVPGYGMVRLDVNHKTADLSNDPRIPSFVAGPGATWAWMGDWQDRNGNGVIDHSNGPANEFVWRGDCTDFTGRRNPGPHCATDPLGASFVGFAWPGGHRAECGLFVVGSVYACAAGGDLPGSAAVCYLDGHALGVLGGLVFNACRSQATDGDPLLGPQGSIAFDARFSDRTGEGHPHVRGWDYDQGWPTWTYDVSIAGTLLFVGAYGAPADPAGAHGVRVEEARFLDVDRHRALHPDLEALVQGQAKPAARSSFALVRDLDAAANLARDAAVRDVRLRTGPLDDALLAPGWAHEPNTPGDVFPGAVYQAHPPTGQPREDHLGWRNNYAGHRAGPRPWLDLQSVRDVASTRPLAFGGLDLLLVSGPWISTAANPEAMGGGRSLGPGMHLFRGALGAWHDRPQVVEVSHFDPLRPGLVTRSFAVGPDGWIGNVLNLTGAHADANGLGTAECTIAGDPGPHPWGWCHPDLDGAYDDSNSYAPGGEFRGACPPSWPGLRIALAPEGGVWTVPVLVWRDTWASLHEAPHRLEDWTGRGEPIMLHMYCQPNSGYLLGLDALVLPLGNVGLRITSTLEAIVGGERVVDHDVYEPVGP
jgi:hypothetical protein